jgi:osmotically-inducible protein OsmY
VPSYAESEAVLFDVWTIPHVAGVKNKLFVKYPSAIDAPQDTEIKSMVEKQIAWNHSTSNEDVDVSVKNGIVQLQGDVDAYWKKFRIEQMASEMKGVLEIENKISVVPTKNVVDEVIAEDITKAFDRSRLVDLENVDIRVENGKVTLSGKSGTPIARLQAMEIARNTLGVKDVVDRLSIG